MKKRLQGIVIGAVVSALLFSGVAAAAADCVIRVVQPWW